MKKVQDVFTEGKFAIVDGSIYFRARGDEGDETLFRAPVAGGSAAPMLDHRWVGSWTTDASGIYVRDGDGIRRVPLAGCSR